MGWNLTVCCCRAAHRPPYCSQYVHDCDSVVLHREPFVAPDPPRRGLALSLSYLISMNAVSLLTQLHAKPQAPFC